MSTEEGRFGRYALLGEIARGGMGVVYRARRDGATEEVALKVLLNMDDTTPDELRRFEREIRAGETLDHPGIVAVLDAGTEKGKRFFTMELVPGTTFGRLQLPLADRVRILEKLARAVDHAHRRGFVHRDIKPSNVMVTPGLEPKLLDFGLARSVGRESHLTRTGTVMGTVSYMAPEQADGRIHETGPATDVWALGVMLYEVLAGRVPFKADAQFKVLAHILAEDPPHPRTFAPDCPGPLAAIALRALEKEPGRRFASAAGFADELARWLETGSAGTRGPNRVGRWVRRRKAALVALGAVLACAGVAGAYALLHTLRRIDAEQRAEAVREADREGRAALAAFDLAGTEPPTELTARVRAVAGPALPAPPGERPAPADTPIAELALALEGARVAARAEPASDATLPGLLVTRRLAPASVAARAKLIEVLLARGSPDRALPLALEATIATPSSAACWEHLARAASELGDPLVGRRRPGEWTAPTSKQLAFAEAEALLEADQGRAIFELRALDRAADKASDIENALRVARALLRAERGHEALAQVARIEASLGHSPSDARLALARGEALLLVDGARGAIAAFEEAARAAAPGSLLATRARLRAARLSAAPRPLDRAKLEEWLRERPGDPLIEAALADPRPAEVDVARLVRASRTASRIARRYPGRGEADKARARSILDLALALDPASPRVIVERVRQHWERKEPWENLDAKGLRAAAEANDAGAEAFVALANETRTEERLALAGRALEHRPEPALAAVAHAARGFALAALARHEDALAALDAAIALWRTLERSPGQDALELRVWEAKETTLRALGREPDALAAAAELRVRGLEGRITPEERQDCPERPYFEHEVRLTQRADPGTYVTRLHGWLSRSPFEPLWNARIAFHLIVYYGCADLGPSPYFFLGRSVRFEPSQMNGFQKRQLEVSMLKGIIAGVPDLAEMPTDEDGVWEEIARRSFHLMLQGAEARKSDRDYTRRLIERAIALDPAQVSAVAARGYLHALDLSQDLALEDAARTEPYFATAALCRLTRALALLSGKDTGDARALADRELTRAMGDDPDAAATRAEIIARYPILKRLEQKK